MDSGRKQAASRFSKLQQRLGYYKNSLKSVSYVLGGAVVALCIWPASAGDILGKVNAASFLTVTSYASNRIHNESRVIEISFHERWSAVPAPTFEPADKKNRLEPPRAESRIEKIPFSCELAFSRLVRKGNFSTRCLADLEVAKTHA